MAFRGGRDDIQAVVMGVCGYRGVNESKGHCLELRSKNSEAIMVAFLGEA